MDISSALTVMGIIVGIILFQVNNIKADLAEDDSREFYLQKINKPT